MSPFANTRVNVQLYFVNKSDYNDLIEWPHNLPLPNIGDEVEYCHSTFIVKRKVFNIDNSKIELFEKEKQF